MDGSGWHERQGKMIEFWALINPIGNSSIYRYAV